MAYNGRLNKSISITWSLQKSFFRLAVRYFTSMTKPKPFEHFAPPVRTQTPLRQTITDAYRRPEADCLADLLPQAQLPADLRESAAQTARNLITALRSKRTGSGVEGLVQEFALSSEEGVALMCLAEALLRIPDDATRDALIKDKIAGGDWAAHLRGDRPLFVNAATWGLVITGKLLNSANDRGLAAALARLVSRAGEPVIRRAVDLAMRLMGEQFVMGQTIDEALKRALATEAKGFTYSYDMLGEAATTAADADRYYRDYEAAIHAIGRASAGRGIFSGPGISIKLSALHPRYTRAQALRVMEELLPRVQALAALAKRYDIGLNIDAEEADRLELSLDVLESLAVDPALAEWNGLGFVVQAYGKRCPAVIDWIVDLAQRAGRRIMVRLVKGAYWDAEIKRTQIEGLADYPVYTRKLHTDVAYIACARKLLAAGDAVFPQFATHNAQTLATILALAGPEFALGRYEFQCLHGMGEPLYEEVVGERNLDRPCRIYAPVGTHETLLAYLVRRLLENGANSSFVNRIGDPGVSIDELICDPVERVRSSEAPGAPHEKIALPSEIYHGRRNSVGLDLSDERALCALAQTLSQSAEIKWTAGQSGAARAITNPADLRDVVGAAHEISPADALEAVAKAAASEWPSAAVTARAEILERAADAMQARMPILLGLLIREAGKSAANAIAEVREAIDYLRYYASQACATLSADRQPLGPVICISPWNFPLAIFTGQVAAALAAGNPVLAKPASDTPLIAAESVRLLHEAGVPADALQLICGPGAIGEVLIGAPQTSAIIFTGSTGVARRIQKQLAKRLSPSGKPIPLIAETGGQNAMIVDSSALAEQVVADVIASAFDSAGQRCSALRVLCLQSEIADRTLTMLKGAMQELRIGSTDRLANDIGPVVNAASRDNLQVHIESMRAKGRHVEQMTLPGETAPGTFVAPTIIEIESIDELEGEVFGPVLHVLRYERDTLDALIAAINGTGFGLTFGLHTRLDSTIDYVTQRINAGNVYINRNVIGAVVGVQPFGGRGLSGTGPKAGGPLYLNRLVANPPQAVGAPSALPNPLLADLISWLQARGESEAAAAAQAYGAASQSGRTINLPGPVGERNLYQLHPRGRILARPSTKRGLFQQIAVILATGCQGVVEGMALPEGLPSGVRQRLATRVDGALAAMIVEGDREAVLRATQAAADRPGAIISVHAASSAECRAGVAYNADWLLEEVSTSINTTAAGGNASLMAVA